VENGRARDARFVSGEDTVDTFAEPTVEVTEFVIGDEFGPLISGVIYEITLPVAA
jgi:hypothetical protein